MQWLLIITLSFLAAYSLLMLCYAVWWQQVPAFNQPVSNAITKVTVVIPARNEAASIADCLRSVLNQRYNKDRIEVIVVNDQSTDNTAAIVSTFQNHGVRLIHIEGANEAAPKKKAIETAIANSNGDIIITTDADCIVPPGWIETIVAYFEKANPVFVAAPVSMQAGNSLLSVFQTIDFLTMQGITAASVHKRFSNMCNGANLAYTKKAFYEVGGFTDINHIASGDDMLLMQKISIQFPGKLGFIKSNNAIVTTSTATSWGAFFQQRIRWASKAAHYKEPVISFVLLGVYCTNLLLLSFLITSFFNQSWLATSLLLLVIKFSAEALLVYPVLRFFKQSYLIVGLLLLQPLHMIYIVIAGFFGQFKRYEWKGRTLK